MKSDETTICSVAVLACTLISNVLAVTNTGKYRSVTSVDIKSDQRVTTAPVVRCGKI